VRRRFLDRLTLAVDPDHAGHGARYERAMRERNRLLRQARDTGRRADGAWLCALERVMAESGTALAAGRRRMLAHLDTGLAAAPPGPFPRPVLAIDGQTETWLDAAPAVEVEDRLAASLERDRARDAEAGRTCDGPHVSDLIVRHAQKDQPAESCSTGEQKALLIAMLLAQARFIVGEGFGLLLLLDEVAAHLDSSRREALFGAILELGLQAWMTGTDAVLFQSLGPTAQFLTFSAPAQPAPVPVEERSHVRA
jgi:DNA replication and repair protein RecF